jgi:histidinol-phosphate aminotransferase
MVDANLSILDSVAPGILNLQPYVPGKPVGELEREYGVSNAIKLASNENPLGASPLALEAAHEALKESERYPDGNGFALKLALSKKLNVPHEWLTLGNGSNEILELIARVFLMPVTNAVFSEHAFAVYPIVTQAVGATANIAGANAPNHVMPYGHDLEAMAALVDANTRVVFVANPNNPTGTWLSASQLEAFIRALPESVVIVVDEAYFEYVQEQEYPDSVRWVERYPNLVVTRTFSKIYGLAGLRIGYAVSQPTITELLNRARQPFNVNAIAMAAAEAALQDHAHVDRSVHVNSVGMQQIMDACDRMGLGYLPSVGNFICVKMPQPGIEVYASLLPEGIILRPIDNYGLPAYLRITIGTEEENQRVITALEKVLAQ